MADTAGIVKETYSEGDHIFFEGDEDYHFYIVESGIIEIFTTGPSGNKLRIAEINAGESFGEFALLERSPRSATARAMTDCALIKVSEAGYEKLLEELPPWVSSMMRSFATRLKSMNERLKNSPQFLEQPIEKETENKAAMKVNPLQRK